MNKTRINGMATEAKGSVIEAIGKLTGDEQTKAKGAAAKVEGKAQAAAGASPDTDQDRLEQ